MDDCPEEDCSPAVETLANFSMICVWESQFVVGKKENFVQYVHTRLSCYFYCLHYARNGRNLYSYMYVYFHRCMYMYSYTCVYVCMYSVHVYTRMPVWALQHICRKLDMVIKQQHLGQWAPYMHLYTYSTCKYMYCTCIFIVQACVCVGHY